MIIFLRGHHLLCIQGFQGYGYSEDFVKNMERIKILIDKKDTKIKVINHNDDICKACPNLTKDNICKNLSENEKIIKMDQEVTSKLQLNNDLISSEELFNKLNNLFNSKEDIMPICNKCSWSNECLFSKHIFEKKDIFK